MQQRIARNRKRAVPAKKPVARKPLNKEQYLNLRKHLIKKIAESKGAQKATFEKALKNLKRPSETSKLSLKDYERQKADLIKAKKHLKPKDYDQRKRALIARKP